MPQDIFGKFKSKKVAVVGAGVANRPLINVLLDCGADVKIYDKKSREEFGGYAYELESRGAELFTGNDYLDNLEGDIIFKTPGMRRDSDAFVKAEKLGCVISSEMELFFELCPCPVIAVTGSDGKTTTCLLYTSLSTLISVTILAQ